MKKIYWTIALLVLLIAIFFLSRPWREQRHFQSDYTLLEKEILEKDSDGKGYSDVVDKRINELTNDPEIKKSLAALAIAARNNIKVKNEEEYIKTSKIMLLRIDCSMMLMNKKEELDKYLSNDTLVYDNKTMYQYYHYLSTVRFGSVKTQLLLSDWMNSEEGQVNKDNYEKRCL